ncbi:MAG: hypothetical protein LBU39_06180 [Desulfobulbaceae bacterium]|jgi:hypothetical protein|nr:hypothetical protein [Desulfobulbaceae bacterium]
MAVKRNYSSFAMDNQQNPRFFPVEIGGVAALFSTLYLLTLSGNYSEAHDAIIYILDSMSGASFHPAHLLYNWLNAMWAAFWQMCGFAADRARCIERLHALVGALVVTAFFVIVRKRVGLSFFAAFSAACLPAFSYGLWLYSTTLEVIVTPLFFLLTALYLLTAPRVSAAACFGIGILHGLAVLFHQMNAFFLLVALDVLLLQKNRLEISHLRALRLYLTPLTLLVIVPYAAVMLIGHSFQSWQEALIWLLNYATETDKYWQGFSLATLASSCIGATHSFIGGHFLFNLPPIKHVLELNLAGKELIDNAFLARHLPIQTIYTLVFLTAAAFALVLAASILAMTRRRGSLGRNPPVWRSGLIFLTVFVIFAIIWNPSDAEFWIIPAMLFWLLMAIFWHGDGKSASRRRAVALTSLAIAICLAAVNYGGSIRWLTQPENDYYRVKIAPIIDQAKPGDLTIVRDTWIFDGYIGYFTKSDYIGMTTFYEQKRERASERLLAAISERLAAGQRVFIMADALQGASLERDAGFAVFQKEASGNLHERYGKIWRPMTNEAGTVYILDAAALMPKATPPR